MKYALSILLSFFPFSLASSQQFIGLPASVPTYCSTVIGGPAITTCPFRTLAGHTGIMIGHFNHGGGNIIDSQGNLWTQRVATPFDDDTIYDTYFTKDGPDYITVINNQVFPASLGNFIVVFVYDGIWNYVGNAEGDYKNQNAPFSDCANGGNCQYNWTMPVEAEAGDLLIGFSDSNNSLSVGVPRPAAGYQIEFNNGLFAIEDMIVPLEGTYIGSLKWEFITSHWVMELVQYRR